VKTLLQMLERLVGGGPAGEKRVKTFRWLLLIGLAGVCLMILSSFLQVKPVDSLRDDTPLLSGNPDEEVFMTKEKVHSPFLEFEEKYEAELRELLEHVVGVGHVEVMVTIDSTEELIVYRNVDERQQSTEERDSHGATRHITDVTRNGKLEMYEVSGGKQPIILKKINPRIRGVVIVAEGAENATVKKLVRDTVSRGLDVPTHRISIVPRKQG